MAETIQYVNKYYVSLREEEGYNNNLNIICFGAMFFEVRVRIFFRMTVFKAPSWIPVS